MARGRQTDRVKWYPVSRPPRGHERVLVYCPSYPYQRIRAISADLLPWCADATHWHPLTNPYPAPPCLRTSPDITS